MTPVDKEDFEDAELARRLSAMRQPEPSPELDAAIFAQVQKDLAPGPAAANDPAPEPLRRPGLLHRYRAPLAFAASLAGIAILLPVWRSMQQHEVSPINDSNIIVDEVAAPAAPAPNAKAEVPRVYDKPDKKLDAPVMTGKLTPPMPKPEMAPRAPSPAPAAAPAPPPPPLAEQAAAPVYAPPPSPAADAAEAPAKSAALARPAAPADARAFFESPKEWLQAIERLLDAGDAQAASAQWKRFRKAHPEYPVPDTLVERLKTLD
ncbi:hypothetical protein [Pseudoduganella violaceinigra]|uniref:hypothetical protein n=1 Tax=Pseudoduganella violaceinigra TaxID=246602 RepID=UPI000408179B|nr:hypothetical protein [Pseudoduganella violaceinigra]